MKIKYDIMIRPWCLGLGGQIGCNRFKKGKPINFFIAIDFLFWTFGLEFINKL